MGIPERQKPVKLVTSIIFREERYKEQAERELKGKYGAVEPLERTLPFDRTGYYYGEMGSPLRRKLLCFGKTVNKKDIYRIKLATNKIENRYRIEGKRTVNIDPGYITEAKLVLLTTKDYTHRIHIGGKIFAESTLFFKDGTFNSWPWTYPDYAGREMIQYFNAVREIYVRDMRKGRY